MIRLAFGNCSCVGGLVRGPLSKAVCEEVRHRLSALAEQALADARAIPREWVETQEIASRRAHIAVIRRDLGSDGTLVVVRAFVHTWRFANFISWGAVGHLRADGFVVDSSGTVRPASDEQLWEFR